MSIAEFDKCLEDIANQAVILMDNRSISHSDFSSLDRINGELLAVNENDENNNQFIETKKIEKSKIINNILLEYFSISGKLILPKRRKVIYSKELQDKIDNNTFTDATDSVVSTEEAAKIKDLISYFDQLIQNGSDITSHLSKGIYDADSPDRLLYTWNVKHIHLNKQEASNKVEMRNNRSGWLLFVMIDDEECDFLDVVAHPHGSGFSSYHFLEIIHNNAWMEKAGFEAVKQGITPQFVVNDTDTLYKLYKANINIPFEFEGTVYFPSVRGLTTAGTNINDTLSFNQWKRRLQSGLKGREYISYLPSSNSLEEGIIMFQDGSQLSLNELTERS